jgi:multicomponent Na+:H+ antiporter subunit E
MRIAILAGFLLVFWLALSGHYSPWLVTMGVVSALAAALAALRMGVVDGEGLPIQLIPGTLTYYPWLAREIAKSAWGVTKLILNPRLPISPALTRVRASQRTPAGIAAYANSITLTPGTITVGVSGNELIVHALEAEGARELESGRMDARVREFEGGA